ncbi:hypothetical protein QQF73_09680 [Marinobacter sp. M216]|uniref:Uncharacterized protein n=1 Tax=Marinobacter albus TaxID=3030833 RepID=A0ABT7HCY8_9GAMM|nr:hypothetical protein [Marinobacter sp. M216]MDK9557892.1 hypothetical protein [Marinobacter sp. M216]
MSNFVLRAFGYGGGNVPSIVVVLTAATVSIIYIPESILGSIGLDIYSSGLELSGWLQYQLRDISNKSSVYLFWLAYPYVFLVNLVAWFFRANIYGFSGYCMRRKNMIRAKGNLDKKDFSLLVGSFVVAACYIVVLVFVRSEPSFLGDFIPNKNRIALTLLHGTGLFSIPAAISVFFAELRFLFDSHRGLEG